MFEKVKKFYDMGLYSAEQVRKFVVKNVITKAEYDRICNNTKAKIADLKNDS